jgi:putative glutamine amidotransferase
MRRSLANGYDEERDSLARDWTAFLRWALPEARWMPLANAGDDTVRTADDWGLQALILTGGDDLGRDVLRDTTETALLAHAHRHGWPVLGICRGLQLMCQQSGGSLTEIDRERHVARAHSIRFLRDFHGLNLKDRAVTVNSYHAIGIPLGTVPRNFAVLAQTDDGYAEALIDAAHKFLGVMWHPERERPFSDIDRSLVRAHLLGAS